MSYQRPRSRLLAALLLLVVAAAGAWAAAPPPTPVGPGTFHTRLYRPEGPWAIHVLSADLSVKYLRFGTLLGGGAAMGRRGVSQMLTLPSGGAPGAPIAGVNGDFFAQTGGNYTTLPLGFHLQDGELVTLPDLNRSAFYVTTDGRAGVARFRGNVWVSGPNDLLYPIAMMNRPPESAQAVLFTPRFGKQTQAESVTLQIVLADLSGPFRPNAQVSARVVSAARAQSVPIPAGGAVIAANGVAAWALRNLKAEDRVTLLLGIEPRVGDLSLAVGGGPRLVRDGAIAVENRLEHFADAFATARHPRTGIGVNGNQVMLVTVDGRQLGYSMGMTLREFAQLFLDLGCTQATNLDGGGSTTMVVRGRIVNSPSDGNERRVADALGLFSLVPALPPGAPPRPAVRLALDPAEVSVLSGDSVRLKLAGLDEYAEPTPVDTSQVQWEVPPQLGGIGPDGAFIAGRVSAATAGLVTARSGDMLASAIVCVVPGPARLSLVPARVALPASGKQQFMLKAYDEDSNAMQVPMDRVTWTCTPESGKVDARGLLRTPKGCGVYTVRAALGTTVVEAKVLVGTVARTIADFEQPLSVSFAASPAGVSGSAAVETYPADAKRHCLKLCYDFSGSTGTRTVQALLNLPLPESHSVSLQVLGDGQGTWLRARVRDSVGRVFPLDLANRVDWSNTWKRVTGWLPEEATFPVTLESIYLTEFHADRKPVGAIYLDDLSVAALPEDKGPGKSAANPESAPTRASAAP